MLINLCLFCNICSDIVVWLFLKVVNFCVCVIGIVVLCGMIFLIKLFMVLRFSDSGNMFNSNMFEFGLLLISMFVCNVVLSVIMWLGLIEVSGFLLKNVVIWECIIGIWVELLIIIICSIFLFLIFVFLIVWW